MAKTDTNVFLRAKDLTAEGLKSAEKNFKKFGRTAKASLATIAKASAIAGTAITGAAGALAAAQKIAVSNASAQAKLARTFGLTTKEMQAWGFAFKASNVEVQEGLELIRAVEISLGEAADGNEEKARLFGEIGISVKDASGQVTKGSDALQQYARHLDKTADKTALVGKVNALTGGKVHEFNEIVALTGGNLDAFADSLEGMGALTSKELHDVAENAQFQLDTLMNQTSGIIQDNLLESVKLYGDSLATVSGALTLVATDYSLAIDLILGPVEDRVNKISGFLGDAALNLDLNDAEWQLKQFDKHLAASFDATTKTMTIAGREFLEGTAEYEAELAAQFAKRELLQLEVVSLRNLETSELERQVSLEEKLTQRRQEALDVIAEGEERYNALLEKFANREKGGKNPRVQANNAETDSENKKQDAVLRGVAIGQQAQAALSAIGGKQFEDNKKAQAAMALVNTGAAVVQTLRTDSQWGGPWAIASAALVGITGLAQVAAIQNTTIGGGAPAAPTPASTEPPARNINSNINVFASRGVGADDVGRIGQEITSELQREFNR